MDTKKLRQKILDLAIHGKLVPQDPNDEPASVLLERIRAEKERLIKEGKIKRGKKSASDTPHYENEPFEVPESWEWTNLGEITNYGNCENVDVNDIPSNGWVLELEDIEKDSARVIQRLTKDERDIKGVRHSFHKGDVLYSKLRTYLNKVMVAPEDGFCTTEIIPVTCMSFILPEYLNHVLRSKYFVDYTIQCGYGVKMPRLSTTDACNGQIPLPPYNEQKHIVASIESWFQIIDILESHKLDLDEAIQKTKSKILDLAIHGKLVTQDPNDEPAIELLKRINPKFSPCDNAHYPFEIPTTWCLTYVKVIVDNPSCKPFQILQSDINDIGQTPVVSQSSNYIEGYSDRNDCVFQNKNAVLIFGDHTRNLKYVDFNFIVGADGVKIIIPHISVKYSYYALQFIINGMRNRGYARHYSVLANSTIPIPPLAEQHRIVAKIEELFAVLDEIQKSIEA